MWFTFAVVTKIIHMVNINSEELGRSFMFASEVPDIKISTDKDTVRLVVKLNDNDGETIYDEYLTPYNGNITVTDVVGIIQPYLRKNLFQRFWILATVEDASSGAYLPAFFLSEAVTLMTDTVSFINKQFLSVLDGVRRTAMGRKEVLHIITTEDTTATIRDYYTDGTYADRTVELEVVKDAGDSNHHKYCRVDASPVPADGKELYRYVVTVGERTQEYILDYDHEESNSVMMFINSFGMPEYLYVNGTIAGEPEYERSAAIINGVYRNYKIKETRFFNADTGFLTEEEESWVLDLLRSQEVYICRNGEPWQEIAITESEAKSSTDMQTLNRYTFKFRIAQKRQSFVNFRTSPSIFTEEYTRVYA